MSLKLEIILSDSTAQLEVAVNKFLSKFNTHCDPRPQVSFTISPNIPSPFIYAYIVYAGEHLHEGAKKK